MHGIPERPAGSRYCCALCGSQDRVAIRQFTRTCTPPWVYVTILLGLLPAAILQMVVSTRHQLAVPFCARCALRHKLLPLVSVAAVFGILFSIIGGAIAAANAESATPFVVALLVVAVVITLTARYSRMAQPKYLKLDAHNVVIHDAVHGPVVLVAPQPNVYYAPPVFG